MKLRKSAVYNASIGGILINYTEREKTFSIIQEGTYIAIPRSQAFYLAEALVDLAKVIEEEK